MGVVSIVGVVTYVGVACSITQTHDTLQDVVFMFQGESDMFVDLITVIVQEISENTIT